MLKGSKASKPTDGRKSQGLPERWPEVGSYGSKPGIWELVGAAMAESGESGRKAMPAKQPFCNSAKRSACYGGKAMIEAENYFSLTIFVIAEGRGISVSNFC